MLTPENQIILLLVRGVIPDSVREQARALLAGPLDWDVILEQVVAQEVYPLFYRNLEALASAGTEQGAGSKKHKEQGAETSGSGLHAPSSMLCNGREQAWQQLQKLSKINAFRNTLFVEELARVLNLLSDAKIPTIPLKGVALAQSLYGDPTQRVCVDTDILVPRAMVGKALRILRDKGYQSEFRSRFFGDVLLRHDIEYALRRRDRGFDYMLELHWGVLWGGKSEKVLMDDLWTEARPATVFGAPAYALSPEWDLLFLCVHAARHQWQGLKWLVDIHEICSSRSFDWEKLTNKASRLELDEILRLTLKACRTLFETPVPSHYSLGELPPWLKIFPESHSSSWSDAFFAARFLPRFPAKLRYAARVLFVPTLAERRLFELPSFLGALYYPLRPLRLGWRWSCAFLAGSRGQGQAAREHGARSNG